MRSLPPPRIRAPSPRTACFVPDRPYEGIAILCTVLLVSVVATVTDINQERRFRALNETKKNFEVVRGGADMLLGAYDLYVGDVVRLAPGDMLAADGIFISGFNLEVDQSGMTDPERSRTDDGASPALPVAASTMVQVTAVGLNSEYGRMLSQLEEAPDETPLQVKLGGLAKRIGYVGMTAAILTVAALCAVHFIGKAITNEKVGKRDGAEAVQFLLIGVSIVVVAVPEGLPLAVTMSLAYSVNKMLKDNNLVRRLQACETMGCATTICSDKTGTLTHNRMTVTTAWCSGRSYGSVGGRSEGSWPPRDLPPAVVDLLSVGVAVNSTANVLPQEAGHPLFQGNPTEGALLVFVDSLTEGAVPYSQLRRQNADSVRQVFSFDSRIKRMSTILTLGVGPLHGPKFRMFTKGAAEIVLDLCTNMAVVSGKGYEVVAMTPEQRTELGTHIGHLASNGLRTLLLAFKDFEEDGGSEWEDSSKPPDSGLTALAIVGIQDPLRGDVVEAVRTCQSAGICVRMVTGDNPATARHIARECGILTNEGVVLEGVQFRGMDETERRAIVPRLQVMARSTPTDKYNLVSCLREMGEVVGVTGDGTNDAPALRKADVGLSMGSGTEVAKQASDVVILDDNFGSIVTAVRWGRSIYQNIRKFIQFQLTVNCSALIITFVSALAPGFNPPLTAIQLLWVNLIMDSFAALALATEPPDQAVMADHPEDYSTLITNKMYKHIIGQGIYQVAVLLTVFFSASAGSIWGLDPKYSHNDEIVIKSLVFNSFVFCQLFNEINCRRINDEVNVLGRIRQSHLFVGIMVSTIVVQFIIIHFGADWAECGRLDGLQWLFTISVGFLSIPFGYLLRLIPVPEDRPPAKEMGSIAVDVHEQEMEEVRGRVRELEAELETLRRQRPS